MSRAWEPLARRTRALLLLYLVAVVIPLPWAAAPVRSDGGETGQPLGFDVGCHVEIGAFVGSSPPAATQVQALEHLVYWFHVAKERAWQVDSSADSLAAVRLAMQNTCLVSHPAAARVHLPLMRR